MRLRLSIATRSAEVPVSAAGSFAVADALQDVRPAAEPGSTAEASASKRVAAALALPSAAVGNLVFVGRSVLVVKLALLVVGKNLVRFVDFLELRLIAAGIGVILACQLAKRLLDGIGVGIAWNA